MMNNPMMNPMMQNYMGNNMRQMGQMDQTNIGLTRLNKEYQLCSKDMDLIQIGCNFGLENDLYHWRVTMTGPKNTPYEGGLFFISIIFPEDYPTHGPEFKFLNKIYHLNVDWKNDLGHICINSINSWRTSGKVIGRPVYTVKQALLDIFCLFFKQGVESAYDKGMADDYVNNTEKFNEEAKKWTKDFAPMN